MDVVKSGRVGNPDDWKAEVTCGKKDAFDKNGCGAILSITIKDLVMMYWRGTHWRHNYPAIRCPQCGKYNMVGVPNLVWKKFDTIRNRKKAIFDGFSD